MITQPSTYDDPELSHRVRSAVHTQVLVEGDAAADDGDEPIAATAVRLAALLDGAREPLAAAEARLLREWLAKLAARDR